VGVAPDTVFESQFGQVTAGMSVAANQGVLISFKMPVPQSGEGEMVDGELHLKWTISGRVFQPPGTLSPATAGTRRSPAVIGIATQAVREDEPEDRFAQLLAGMTTTQRATFNSRMPQKSISRNKVPLTLAAPRQIASLPTRSLSLRARRPRVRAVPDAQKKAKDQQKLDALHAVYGNNIPGFSPGTVTPPRRRVP